MRKIIAFSILLYGISLVNAQQLTQNREPHINDFVYVEDEPKVLNYDEVLRRIGYPAEALKSKIEGKVYLRLLVDDKGRCIKYTITRAAHPLLNEAVVPFITQLQFIPARQNNKPVSYWSNLVFTFDVNRYNRTLHVRQNPFYKLERKIISCNKKAERHLRKAEELADAGRYEDALEELWKSKRRNPANRKFESIERSIKIHHQLGRIYHKLGKYHLALDKMTEAIGAYMPFSGRYPELDQLAPHIYLQRAVCLLKINEPMRAMQDLNLVIFRFPAYAGRAFNIKGLAYSKLQNHEEALANVQRAIELDPINPESFVFKAMVLFSLEGSKAARESLGYAETLGMNRQQSIAFMNAFR